MDWAADSNGLRQTVYNDNGTSLTITLTYEGIIIDLYDKDGEFANTHTETYDEITERLSVAD